MKKSKGFGGRGRGSRSSRDKSTSLKMALEAADMVTWEWDLCNDFIRYSDNVPELAKGKNIVPYITSSALLQTIHPEDREATARAFYLTRTKGFPFECEYRVRMQDGKYHWILGKGKSVVVKSGKPVRALGISQDITTRKQAEEELQKRTRQLAALASERTLIEHRERRRVAEIMHENLQQILVAASFEADTLATSKNTTMRLHGKTLRDILSEAMTVAKSMIQDLAPPISLRRNLPVAFDWLARHVYKRYRLSVHVNINQALMHTPEPIGVLLFTAARELLLNVVKHSGKHQAELSLRRQSGAVILEIRDRGRGISPKRLKATEDQQGFGLFSIRERVELLGGKLTVESIPDQGTRVVISLPIPRQSSAKPREGT